MGVLRITFLSALALELLATLSTAIVAVEIGFRLLYANMEFRRRFSCSSSRLNSTCPCARSAHASTRACLGRLRPSGSMRFWIHQITSDQSISNQ